MRIIRSLAILLILAAAAPLTASSQDRLVTGEILIDDEVVQIPLTLRTTRTRVTLESHGYRGGTTKGGEVVEEGGFDTLIGLYDANGELLGAGDDIDEPRNDLDARVTLKKLAPGDYTIVVTQYNNNLPKKITKDFERVGQGNFTAIAFGDGTGQFWDLRGNQRDGEYGFEIIGAGCSTQIRQSCLDVDTGISSLSMDNTGTVSWKWNNGPKTKKKKFGAPTTKTDYDLCLYEDDTLVLELATRAGSRWKATKKGFKYAKSGGNKDGVKNVKLVGGGDGAAKMKLKAIDADVVLPFGNAAVVTAQLVSGQGRCWEGVFDAPSVSNSSSYEASTPP